MDNCNYLIGMMTVLIRSQIGFLVVHREPRSDGPHTSFFICSYYSVCTESECIYLVNEMYFLQYI